VNPHAGQEAACPSDRLDVHGAEAADRAQGISRSSSAERRYPTTFRAGRRRTWRAGDQGLLVQTKLAKSGSDAWRAVDQGAVSIDGVKVSRPRPPTELKAPSSSGWGEGWSGSSPPAGHPRQVSDSTARSPSTPSRGPRSPGGRGLPAQSGSWPNPATGKQARG